MFCVLTEQQEHKLSERNLCFCPKIYLLSALQHVANANELYGSETDVSCVVQFIRKYLQSGPPQERSDEESGAIQSAIVA